MECGRRLFAWLAIQGGRLSTKKAAALARKEKIMRA